MPDDSGSIDSSLFAFEAEEFSIATGFHRNLHANNSSTTTKSSAPPVPVGRLVPIADGAFLTLTYSCPIIEERTCQWWHNNSPALSNDLLVDYFAIQQTYMYQPNVNQELRVWWSDSGNDGNLPLSSWDTVAFGPGQLEEPSVVVVVDKTGVGDINDIDGAVYAGQEIVQAHTTNRFSSCGTYEHDNATLAIKFVSDHFPDIAVGVESASSAGAAGGHLRWNLLRWALAGCVSQRCVH